MPLQSPVLFRRLATAFAIALGLQAAWILAAELTRPDMRFFPQNAADAKIAAAHSSQAAAAAWTGWPRGELWNYYAVALNAGLVGNIQDRTLARASDFNNKGKDVAEIAASLSPSDARAWLLLAMNTQTTSNADMASAQLKMSYYTSPYKSDLFPLRIHVATQSPGITEDELSSFVEYELGVAVRNEPGLKGFIASAYRAAPPAGRRFFETALTKLNPKYLAEIKAARS